MSKSFTFSLQKVFEFRKNIENKRAVKLSNAQTALKKKKEELNQLKIRKEETFKNAGDETNEINKIDLNKLKVNKDYILQLSEDIKKQKEQVSESGKIVENSRGKLLNATKDKKILEKLKTRYYDEYKKMKKLAENKNEDEVTGRLALNKRKMESR